MLDPQEWRRVDTGEWRLSTESVEGRATLNETNSGFIASITVSDKQFDMELLDARDFFPNRDEALAFLKQHMEKQSY